MKIFVCTIAALACLMAAPVLIAPAAAQVSVGVGDDGPTVRIGPRDRHMDRDRGRHYRAENRADCREVTVKTRRPDGSVSIRTTQRCD